MKKIFLMIVLTAGALIIGWKFLLQARMVVGRSMEPNFNDRKTYWLDLVSYKLFPPKRGEVMIYHPWSYAPIIKDRKQERSEAVGRIVGLPGEKIMTKDGDVYINGLLLEEPYLPRGTKTRAATLKDKLLPGVEITIPEDTYFVLGDNRDHSLDSRTFGPILEIQIVGRLVK